MAQGFTLWFTGRSAPGIAGLTARVEEALLERGLNVERLDEEEVRATWFPGLGCDLAEEEGLTRFVGHICHLLTRNGVIAVAAAVSPSRELRNEMRSLIGSFAEVSVNSPPEGSDAQGIAGSPGTAGPPEQPGPCGAPRPYEEPVNPEILVETGREDPEKSVQKVLRTLELLEWIPRVGRSDYSEEEEATITQRLKDLGYI